MVVAGLIIIGVLFLFVSYQADGLRIRYKQEQAAHQKLQADYDFLKETVASWTTKPVYAVITDGQIEQIGKIVGEYVKEPKWLN